MAEALYRKYRPQVFEDVVGQEPIERTLKNAIRQDKVSHAYLFCGPRGTGKTTTARLLAKALLCQAGPTPDPDGTCEDCQLIAEGAHPDVYELDAASRTGVENVREEIISRVHFAPTRGRYKVYIIDEVHMLSTAAFNALLKTLEEPPSHVVFVLCTTDPQKVPETIHSRCQRFDYRRISPESMVSRLGAICVAEGVDFEGEALDLIAQRAEGGLRNALTSLEQIIAFENGKVTLVGAERLLGSIDSNDMAEIMAYVGKRDIANCFRWTADYIETGADLAQFVRDMGEHVRNLYIMALVGDDAQLDITETARRELASELAWFGPDRSARLLGVIGDLMAELKTTSNQRLAFEIALTRMVRPDSDLTLESLAERVEALESGYSAVAHVLPGAPSSARTAQEPDAQPSAPASQYRNMASEGRRQAPEASFTEATQGVPAGGDDVIAGSKGQAASSADAAPAANAVPVVDSDSSHSGTPATGVIDVESRGALQETAGMSSVALQSGGAEVPGSKAASLANPAALQRIWQAVLVDVKKRKQAYGVLFMGTKATFDEAKSMIRVVFPSESSFAFNAVQKPDVQSVLEEALAKAVGESVAFCYEKGSESTNPVMQSPARGIGSPSAVHSASPQQSEQQSARRANPMAEKSATGKREAQEDVRGERRAVEQDIPPVQQATQQTGVPSPSAGQAPSVQGSTNYDQVPYDEVPYDEVPYDDYSFGEVPYDDMGGAYQAPPLDAQAAPVSVASQPSLERGRKQVGADAAIPPAIANDSPSPTNASASPSLADTSTSPSPADASFTPDGATREDVSTLEAMLQASFGDSVVLRETCDD